MNHSLAQTFVMQILKLNAVVTFLLSWNSGVGSHLRWLYGDITYHFINVTTRHSLLFLRRLPKKNVVVRLIDPICI